MPEEKLPIVIKKSDGTTVKIGEGTIDENGVLDAVIDNAEYTGFFKGSVEGFSILPDTFRPNIRRG